MQRKYFKFDLEDASMFLSCATKSFQIILEEMEENLLVQKKTNLNLGPDHLLDCCDAMRTPLRELHRINESLEALVHEEFHREEGQ